MRKIINGKKYDTETAEFIGSWDNGAEVGDLDWYGEELYRKRTGEYFVLAEGGARSRLGRPDSLGGMAGGHEITPMAYEGARRWAEGHMSADDYETEFGEVDDPTDVAMTVRVPASAKAALDRECSRTGESRSAIVARLLTSLAES